MLGQLSVGLENAAAGATIDPRGSGQGDTVVSELHGRYALAALNGNIYCATNAGAGITLVAANCIGAAVPAAGAAQPILALLNPATSKINLVINRTKIQTLSAGTPAGGFMFGFLNGQSGLYTGIMTNKGVKASNLSTGSTAVVIPNLSLAGTTLPVTELRGIGGSSAVAVGAGLYCVDEETAGDIIVPPGAILGIFGQGIGTNHIVKATLVWEECPDSIVI